VIKADARPPPPYLDALLDPEVAAHGLPVLRAADVEQPLVHAPLHGGVEHLEELRSDERLSAAEPRQEGRLQLGRDVAARKALVPKGCDGTKHLASTPAFTPSTQFDP